MTAPAAALRVISGDHYDPGPGAGGVASVPGSQRPGGRPVRVVGAGTEARRCVRGDPGTGRGRDSTPRAPWAQPLAGKPDTAQSVPGGRPTRGPESGNIVL